jgi:hypothetical protein
MLPTKHARSVQAPLRKMTRDEMKPDVAAFFHEDRSTSDNVGDPRAKRAANAAP